MRKKEPLAELATRVGIGFVAFLVALLVVRWVGADVSIALFVAVGYAMAANVDYRFEADEVAE